MTSKQRIAREILDTRRLALGHATTPQLTSSSLDGGRIDFNDEGGAPVGGIGLGDNGFGVEYYDGPQPPKPTAPTVSADAGIFRVEWDGSFASNVDEDGELATADFDRVEVHASMDENFVPDRVLSFAGAFASVEGGSFTFGPLTEAGTYFFRLVARSKAGKYSTPSDRVEQELAMTSIDLEITDAWLTGEAAQNTADGKNSIWRGPDEPEADPDAPFTDGDIWFEMTEDGKSIPNIWDEDAGEWVGNDDYRQSEIEKVQDELRQDLDDIVIDGSGTKNFYRDTMPTDEESSEGDLWFDSSDKNKPYIYQDGEWITVASSFNTPGAGEQLSSLAGGDSLEKAVTSDTEFARDASRASRWTYTGTGAAGDMTFAIPAVGGVDASTFDMTFDGTEASKVGLGLVADAALYINSPGGAPLVEAVFLMAGGAVTSPTAVAHAAPVEDGTGGVSGATHHVVDLPSQAKNILEIYLAMGYAEQIAFGIRVTLPYASGAWVDMSALSVTQAVTSDGITDGAITTDKIAVGAITAESGIIGSINAGTITVGEMNGARIKAGTIDAELALIESSIGSTLIKDGAILTDKIATGAITAESGIIGSIDANVITVGKIMGNQLDADAINGKTITGATIRTASSGSRVELTQNGLKQYNSLGATIVDMTAGSFALEGGSITGSNIRTAATGNRVELSSTGLKQYGNNGSDDDEVLVDMTGGSLTMRGLLEQGNDTSTMQVGPLDVANEVSPGIRWVNGVFEGQNYPPTIATVERTTPVTPSEDSGHAIYIQGPDNNSSAEFGNKWWRHYARGDVSGKYAWMYQDTNFTNIETKNSSSLRSNLRLDARSGEGSYLQRQGSANSAQWVDLSDTHSSLSWHGSDADRQSYLDLTPDSFNLRAYGASGDLVSGLWGNPDVTTLSAYKRPLELYGHEMQMMRTAVSGGETLIISPMINQKSYGSESANVYISGGGGLGRVKSSRRYKMDIEYADTLMPNILDVQPRSWIDRSANEAWELAQAEQERIGIGPLTSEFMDAAPPHRGFGAIAEEVDELGLESLVVYDSYGRPESLNYDRFAIALIPEIRGLRDRVETLEAKIETLEAV